MLTTRISIIALLLLFTGEKGWCLDCSGAWKICSQNSDNNCETCVQSHPCCSWCTDLSFSHKRCNTEKYLLDMKCSRNGIFSAGNSKVDSRGEVNMPFANAEEKKNQPAVQIRPQKLNVQLRLNEPVRFQLQYKTAKDYPLDLYYLMDLTYSMREDLQTMIKLGSEMTNFLHSLARTYQIGFGYFMDKVVMPFSFNNKELLDNPCSKSGTTCERGYDFIHALNFTTEVKEFIRKLNSSKITANLDDLEGGTDAIMQIVVCKEHMKWRKYSRKIIVVATDGRLHFAGDGILAGIIKKNPAVCLIDIDGSYSGALEYDYPSLEEIYRKLLEYKVNLLFAAKHGVYPYYGQLQQTIPDVSFVGELEEKSENIFQLIEKSYMKVVSSARFEAKTTDNIKVTFHTTCNKKGGKVVETNSCDNIRMGEVYTFNVTMELVELPADDKGTIIIEEMNLAENLEINVEYLGVHCHCDSKLSVECGQHGDFECGKCICNEGWAGSTCEKECSKSPCQFVNETYISTTCYRHGECDRSTCECICDNDYMGQYCEYDQCKRNRGKLCSNNGECEKGACICNDKYEGDDCSCYTGIENCVVPGKDLCSGGGVCDCGQCRCHEGYTGERCEYCPSCAKICRSYDDCVTSVAQNRTTDACRTNETQYITEQATGEIEAKCLARYFDEYDTKCEIKYTYFVQDGKIKLEYLEPYCPPPFYASTPAILAFVLIPLIGIGLLIIWRIRATRKDKLAYKKFMEEVEKSNFGNEMNPIYRSPVRKYFNPIRNEEMFETRFKSD